MPWEIRNYRIFGKIIPITSAEGANLYIANNPVSTGGSVGYRKLMNAGIFHLGDDEDEIDYNKFYRDKALAFIQSNPGRFAILIFKRLAWFYHLDYHYQGSNALIILFHSLLCLAFVGIWLTRRQWRRTILLIFVIVNFTAVHAIYLPEGRYRLPLLPIVFVFASMAIVWLFNHIKRQINAERVNN